MFKYFCCCSVSDSDLKQDELDDDVMSEQRRVYQHRDRAGELIVQGLSKQYQLHNLKRVMAVRDVTFGVQPGEVRQP